jgi:hypothetical protein
LVRDGLSAGKLFQYDVRFTTEDKPKEDLFALKKHRELRVQIYKAFIEGHWQVGVSAAHLLLASVSLPQSLCESLVAPRR